MSVEVRKNGDGDHELGAEIGGAWVAFVTKSGGYVDHLIAKADEVKASQPKQAPVAAPVAQPAEPAGGDGGDGGQGNGGENAANNPG